MTISEGTTSQRMNRTTDECERICAMSEDYKPELRWKITAETTIDDGHEEHMIPERLQTLESATGTHCVFSTASLRMADTLCHMFNPIEILTIYNIM